MKKLLAVLAVLAYVIAAAAGQEPAIETRTWSIELRLETCGCSIREVEIFNVDGTSIHAVRNNFIEQWPVDITPYKSYPMTDLLRKMASLHKPRHYRVTVKSAATKSIFYYDLWVSPFGIAETDSIPDVPDGNEPEAWRPWFNAHRFWSTDFYAKFGALYYKADSGIVMSLMLKLDPSCKVQ